MQAEAAPFIEHLGLEKVSGVLPAQLACDVFSGSAHGVRLHVVTNGARARALLRACCLR
jgi:hypothetical protein